MDNKQSGRGGFNQQGSQYSDDSHHTSLQANIYTGPERRESGTHSSRRHDEHMAVLKHLDTLSANNPWFYLILAVMLTLNLLILAVNISTYKQIGDARLLVIDTINNGFHENELLAKVGGTTRQENINTTNKREIIGVEGRLRNFIENQIKDMKYDNETRSNAAIHELKATMADIEKAVNESKNKHTGRSHEVDSSVPVLTI